MKGLLLRGKNGFRRDGSSRTFGTGMNIHQAILVTPSLERTTQFYSQIFPSWKVTKLSDKTYQATIGNNIVGYFVKHQIASSEHVWRPVFPIKDISQWKHGNAEWKGSHEVLLDNVIEGHYFARDNINAPYCVRQVSKDECVFAHDGLPTAGHLNWWDLLTDKKDATTEISTACVEEWSANFYSRTMGVDTHVQLPFPGGKYVVIFDGHAFANKNKLGGILPRAALLPSQQNSFWLPFFSVSDEDRLEEAIVKVTKLGGQVVFPATTILDGKFAIVRDINHCPFALFNRTDNWEETRDYSNKK